MSQTLSASTLLAVPLAPLVGSALAGLFGTAFGRLPLKGAPLAARQSRFRGGPGIADVHTCLAGEI